MRCPRCTIDQPERDKCAFCGWLVNAPYTQYDKSFLRAMRISVHTREELDAVREADEDRFNPRGGK